MWVEPKDTKESFVDVNEELSQLKGELSEKDARASLGRFLEYNLAFTVRILTGMILHPRQVLYIKSWWHHNFNLAIWGRGAGKSTLVGIFAVLYAIFNPNTSILIVSQNFRSSRRILENIERLVTSKAGILLRQCFKNGKLTRRPDIFEWQFANGSKITAVPLSNGEGLRGLRATVLIVDEALLVPMKIIREILQPFLVAAGDVTEKMRVHEKESELIRKGLMTEDERSDFPTSAKMILLSSASYQWEDLYKIYNIYCEKAQNDPAEKREVASYCVTQLSYESVPEVFLDKAILEDVTSGDTPQSIIEKEYKARFIQNSSSYFNLEKMVRCTIQDGERPTVEIVGEKGAEYILGIDPSFSSAENSDHFSMRLLKIIRKPDGKKIGLLVNSYDIAGGNLKDHILYLYYLITHFNIVYIAIDSSGGDSNEFINSCNNSQLFKSAGIDLKDLDAEFNKDVMDEIPAQIKKSYNLDSRRIVQKQFFSAMFQKYANEYLQACIDYHNIAFASKIQYVDGLGDSLAKQYTLDLILGLNGHSQLNKMGIWEFMEAQGDGVDLTKKECALIEPSLTDTGLMHFGLPPSLRRSKSMDRIRKDGYSALLLANWGLKLYLASQEVKTEGFSNTFEPVLV